MHQRAHNKLTHAYFVIVWHCRISHTLPLAMELAHRLSLLDIFLYIARARLFISTNIVTTLSAANHKQPPLKSSETNLAIILILAGATGVISHLA